MPKQISIKLKKVQYGGDSIGKDIRIETNIKGRFFAFDRTIKHGSTVDINQGIAGFPADQPLNAQLDIKVIEKDYLFNDVGTNSITVKCDPQTHTAQEFIAEVRVREWNRIFRKSTAVFTLTFQAQATENITKLRPYNFLSSGEDYNRYDQKIIEAVDFWNDEFAKQDYPPPTLLDPGLVKAMMYVESRVGYGLESNDPDVMQVGHPDDPALHTLNNDGWISSKTGNVARENEWQAGSVKVLDYGGEANAGTIEASLKWGIRWLYHRAQYTKDNKRFWFTWQEAIKRYGPPTGGYESKVWKIYTEGIDPQRNKLWMIIFPLLLLPGLIFGGWALSHQGKTYITFKDMEDTSDYRVIARVVNGLWFEQIQLAITYSNAGNWYALDKDKPVVIDYMDIDNDGQNEVIVSGSYFGGSTIKYVLKKEYAGYRLVSNEGEEGDIRPAFRDQRIEFKHVEGEGALEAVTYFVVPYSNAPDQLWTKYYYLDWDGIYKFYKKDKTDCPCAIPYTRESVLTKYISNSSE